MILHVIGSSSAGNGYALQTSDRKECLILECGCQLAKYAKAISHRITTIRGALVTHEHGDHAKFIADFHAHGIKTFTTPGTWKAAVEKFGGNAFHNTEFAFNQWFNVGGFSVLAVSSQHDAAEPCNFVIRHAEMEDLLFITDTMDFPYTTTGVTNIMVETNFDMQTIETLLPDAAQRMRLVSSHMSVQTAVEVVRRQDTRSLKNIILIHLSSRHGNENKFKIMMMENFGQNITVAKPGTMVNLSSNFQF